MKKIKFILLSIVMPLLPKRLLSRFVGRLARLEHPAFLIRWGQRAFVNYYKINMEEAEKPLSAYKSLEALFTRRLKPGRRPLGDGLVHPADAVVTQAGQIRGDSILQIKGLDYSVADLVGDQEWAQTYEGGFYATYYLCPTDYHRVHSPVNGMVVEAHHMAGELWPVNEWSVQRIRNLFPRNERVAIRIATGDSEMTLVMVGATNVGQMSLSFDPEMITNTTARSHRRRQKYRPGHAIKKGDEIGTFHMGSTVVLLATEQMHPPSLVTLPVKTSLGETLF